RAEELFKEALRIAERLGDGSGIRWLRAQLGVGDLMLGRWDVSLQHMDQFVRECEAGSPHYMETMTRRERGHIREARGDLAGALADYEAALSLARSANDPQEVGPSLGALVGAFEMRGRTQEARDLAREVVDVTRRNPEGAALVLAFDFLLTDVALE